MGTNSTWSAVCDVAVAHVRPACSARGLPEDARRRTPGSRYYECYIRILRIDGMVDIQTLHLTALIKASNVFPQ